MATKNTKAKVDSRPPGLYRSTSDVWIGGVCGGIAEKLEIQSWVVRLVWFLTIFGYGAGILVYIALWIFLPTR